MHPALRFVLVVIGALVGSGLPGEESRFLATVVGALFGLGIGEAFELRRMLSGLSDEVSALRRSWWQAGRVEVREPPVHQPTTTAVPQAPPAPARAQLTQAAPSAPPPLSPPVSPQPWSAETAREPYDWTKNPLIGFLRDYFTGGNTLVRSGVIVLFFGVAFLLRYLAEHSHIPIEFKLSAVAVGALVMLVLGWRLRARRRGYALALQGGAIGILYLTIFSALHLYTVITPSAAFGLLVAISALLAALAVLQGSLAVALLAVSGGFLAPFLASNGHGDHVALFSYFGVLNAVVLSIAWFRSWRPLNLAGFLFTFVLGTTWGVLQYRPEDFASTEPFLVGFFLLYVAVAVLYSLRQAPQLRGYVDGTIVFGTPLAAFGLQAAMLRDQHLALAYSALATSALYVALAWVMHRLKREQLRMLVEAFMALGTAFLTLAVPLALDGRWSAASWALEGAALVWIGCRQQRRLPRAFGALLQLAAGGSLVLTMLAANATPSGTYIAGMMVGLASVYAARQLHAHASELAEYESALPNLLFFWGVLWWCAGGIGELGAHIASADRLAANLVFLSVTALLSSALARVARMAVALFPAFALIPVMMIFAVWAAVTLPHPLAAYGWAGWPLAFAAVYLILRQHDEGLVPGAASTAHTVTLWLLAALSSWEVAWVLGQVASSQGAWPIVAWALVPATALALLPAAVRRIGWPFGAHRSAYLVGASAGFAVYLVLWSLVADVTVSNPSVPLGYIPILNPLDLTQLTVFLVLVRTGLRLRNEQLPGWGPLEQRPAAAVLAVIAFGWANAVLLRSLHVWMGIPYELHALLASTLVETALSVFWAFLALITMLVATRVRARMLWLTGAGLLVAVVVKLFVVDLASIGTIERIVSFVAVGMLMLILGYFSPLPPAAEEAT